MLDEKLYRNASKSVMFLDMFLYKNPDSFIIRVCTTIPDEKYACNNISETCLMYVSRIKKFFGHVCGGLVCLPTYLGCPKCLLIAKHEKVDETYYALTTLTNYLHRVHNRLYTGTMGPHQRNSYPGGGPAIFEESRKIKVMSI